MLVEISGLEDEIARAEYMLMPGFLIKQLHEFLPGYISSLLS